MSHYPVEKGFTTALENAGLAASTIQSYSQTIDRFLTYLRANRPAALTDGLNAVTTMDLRAYLSYLRDQRQITANSYNKTLAQLNRYFTYLFINHLISGYPTLPLHGRAVAPVPANGHGEWLGKLPRILADDQVSFYTRLTLLLLARGFTVGEFLQPGFYQVWEQLPATLPNEQAFRHSFANFHQPLAAKQQCPDLFLKQRISLKQPRLSNAALHKYLARDQRYLNFRLAPSALHQDYVLTQLAALAGQPNSVIMDKLHLDPSSLLYYQRLLLVRQSQQK